MNDAPNVSDTSDGAFRILESITDAFFALDRAFRFTYVNAQAERLLARRREELLGRNLWDEFPQAVGSTFERQYRQASDEQAAVAFEEFFPPLSAWFEVRAFPSPDGLSVFFHDVTAQVERRRRERFLADLAERARGITDPDDLIADAVHSVGGFFGVGRCLFADIDIEADTCAIHPHYRADESVLNMEGVVPISAFGSFVVAEYAARRAVAVDDVRRDPLRVPPETVGAYEAFGIIAHVTVPAVHSGRVVSCMSVHSAVPRQWTPADVDLLRAVVERTWLTVEVTRQERALVREAGERREEAERTASILESITDAFFTLDRDWRVTRINDQAERLMTKTRDQLLGRDFWEAHPGLIGSTFEREYRRAMTESVAVSFEVFYPPLDAWLEVRVYPSTDGLSVFYQDVSPRKRAEEARRESEGRYRLLLESTGEGIYGIDLAGRFTFVNHAAARMLGFTPPQIVGQNGHGLIHHSRPDGAPYPESECPIYRTLHGGGGVHAEDDVFWRADGTSFPVAYSASPILEGGAVRGAVVTFSDIGERRALEQERERLARRERNIATRLQEALQPALPEYVSGLAVASYTRPALQEAQIGGDFFDVFPLDKGLYALVIADVSGKGLAAAQQLALIRNSLRTTLYLYRTPAQAAQSLNAILTAHDLLVGFVTAFVGIYEATTGRITYACCGHEPGLVRRAGGTVEELGTTGPPLGVDQNAAYEEKDVTLASRDALLLYTDGMSEAGPSRRELLGTAGLTRLLALLPEGTDVQAQAEALVSGVGAYAGGVFRDDVAVLLARRL